ncbi:MAG: hypothetical protein AAF432_05380 [Planctomycetota bacterium]
MANLPEDTSHATCPRCGYALNGQIAAWTDQCPLDGTCAECGLEFAWGDLLTNRLHTPKWCIEYGKKRDYWHRLIRTLVLMCWPWSFWKRLRLEHTPRTSRLVTHGALAIVLTYLSFAVLTYVSHRLVAVPSWYQQNQATPRRGLGVELRCAQETLVMPWRTDGVFNPKYRGWRWVANWNAPSDSIMDADRLRPIVALALHGAMISIFVAALFTVLPVSRREAKVKFVHIARAAMYPIVFACAWLVVCLGAGAITTASWSWGLRGTLDDLLAIPAALLMIIPFVWLPFQIVWWSVATRRYLRMPHSWGIGILLVIAATQMSIAIYAYGTKQLV